MPPVRMEFAWCVDRIVYAPHAASDTASRRRISRSKFFEYQYDKIQNWYVSKDLPSPDYAEACDLCTMKCPGCGERITF